MKANIVGRLVYIILWDLKGHWITDEKGYRNNLWVYAGTAIDKLSDKKAFTMIIGPIGIVLHILKK